MKQKIPCRTNDMEYTTIIYKEGILLYFKKSLVAITALLLAFSTMTGCSHEPSAERSNNPVTLRDGEKDTQMDSNYELDSEFYLGETVFIGDSRTNGLLTYEFLPPEQVFAIDGSTQKSIRERNFIQLEPNGKLLSIQEAVKQRQPHRILLAFGVNAIPTMNEKEFMEEYRILVDELVQASPESEIVIQSILPVSWWLCDKTPALTNENIDDFNDLLENYAEENGYVFFDISDHFKDSDGGLDSTYGAGDGLHFNQRFYEEYLQVLITEHP